MQMLSIDQITLDHRCQPRASMDTELIQDYAAAMTEGAEFPPLTVYRDGSTYWLADGFHRIAAAQEAGQAHVICNVERGTIRDAILHAVGANSTHGKRRTNLDKRRAVETLLTDDEWGKWSDSEIARRCAVSQPFVSTARKSLQSVISDTPTERTYTDRYGNVRTMNTENIGKSRNTATVDRDTGEIVDDDYPDAEVVDPSDPSAFVWEPPPQPKSSPPKTQTLPDYAAIAEREADRFQEKYPVLSDAITILEHMLDILEERFEP